MDDETNFLPDSEEGSQMPLLFPVILIWIFQHIHCLQVFQDTTWILSNQILHDLTMTIYVPEGLVCISQYLYVWFAKATAIHLASTKVYARY